MVGQYFFDKGPRAVSQRKNGQKPWLLRHATDGMRLQALGFLYFPVQTVRSSTTVGQKLCQMCGSAKLCFRSIDFQLPFGKGMPHTIKNEANQNTLFEELLNAGICKTGNVYLHWQVDNGNLGPFFGDNSPRVYSGYS